MITKRKENSKCDKLVEQSLESSIRDFIEIFQSSDMAEEYFAEYIDSFSRCLDNLKNRKVSVGVIGITSSGKSTLLNAILGEKILPQKVRPSSGVQVICEFGEKLEAEIYFKKESGKPVKKVTSHIYATLEKYGDECKNPANKEDVEEIRVYSPSFRLGKNISLVDTPGLDAYELKNHEEITLRLVLPSVQMIMFLTTVKASSDQKNLEIIDSVTTDDKPLIVVQNMIDSINPKESIRGIEKNQEEVRREHFDRVTRLLGKAEKKSVKNAPVIQVSAKNALNGDWNGSGLAHLEKGLKLLLEKNKPRVLTLFKSQIACRLKVIREGLDASDEKEQIYENNLQKLKQIEDKLKRDENYFDQKRETIDEIIEGISSEAWNLIERIHRYYMENARDISQDNYDITTKTIGDTVYRKLKNWDNNFKQEQDRIKQAMEDSFLQLNTLMKNIEKLLKDLCENDKLNLQQIDIIKRSGTTYFSANIAIPIKQISEKHCDLIEIPWYRGGGVRRCWGSLFGSDAGYDKNEYDVTVDYIDIQKMLFNMLNKLREWRTCLGDKLQEFADNTLYSFKKMNKELTGQVNSLEKTRTVVIEHEIRDRVLHMIDVFIGHDKINNESCEAITNPTEVFLADPENLKQTEQDCNALSLALYRLSKIVSFKRLYNARDVILKDAGSSDCKTLVLWGWDSNYLNILVDLFFSDCVEENISDNESVRHIHCKEKFSQIIIINENQGVKHDTLKIPDDAVYFILLNAIQSGSWDTRLKKSILHKLKTQSVVWVMDSVKGHFGGRHDGDNLIETFMEFIGIIENSKKSISGLMVADRDLYYTVLFQELYFNSQNWKTATAKQHFIAQMAECFKLDIDKTDKTGEYLKQYTDYNKINEE